MNLVSGLVCFLTCMFLVCGTKEIEFAGQAFSKIGAVLLRQTGQVVNEADIELSIGHNSRLRQIVGSDLTWVCLVAVGADSKFRFMGRRPERRRGGRLWSEWQGGRLDTQYSASESASAPFIDHTVADSEGDLLQLRCLELSLFPLRWSQDRWRNHAGHSTSVSCLNIPTPIIFSHKKTTTKNRNQFLSKLWFTFLFLNDEVYLDRKFWESDMHSSWLASFSLGQWIIKANQPWLRDCVAFSSARSKSSFKGIVDSDLLWSSLRTCSAANQLQDTSALSRFKNFAFDRTRHLWSFTIRTAETEVIRKISAGWQSQSKLRFEDVSVSTLPLALFNQKIASHWSTELICWLWRQTRILTPRLLSLN